MEVEESAGGGGIFQVGGDFFALGGALDDEAVVDAETGVGLPPAFPETFGDLTMFPLSLTTAMMYCGGMCARVKIARLGVW